LLTQFYGEEERKPGEIHHGKLRRKLRENQKQKGGRDLATSVKREIFWN